MSASVAARRSGRRVSRPAGERPGSAHGVAAARRRGAAIAAWAVLRHNGRRRIVNGAFRSDCGTSQHPCRLSAEVSWPSASQSAGVAP